MPSKQNPSNTKPLSKIPSKKPRPQQKPNVRTLVNEACAVAALLVDICGKRAQAGQLLDEDEIRNFKLASDILLKARQLTIQSKASTVPTQQILIQASSSAVSDELRQLAAAVITNESKREKTK